MVTDILIWTQIWSIHTFQILKEPEERSRRNQESHHIARHKIKHNLDSVLETAASPVHG